MICAVSSAAIGAIKTRKAIAVTMARVKDICSDIADEWMHKRFPYPEKG
jgi:hypothetical protein